MSSKKDDIIGKQRKIAELMGRKKEVKASSHQPKPVQADQPKPVQAAGQTRRQSRPSLKRPSTSSVLEAARAQAAASLPQATKKSSTGSNLAKSPKLVRKTKSAPSEGKAVVSRLANLVQNAAKNSLDGDMSSSFATNVSPDDFWKNMREWNFVGDLRRQQQGTSEAEGDTQTLQKPIPDTFINVRHYVAVWGPKVIAEARAQLLSEVATEYGQNLHGRSPLLLVNVETTWKSGRRGRGLHTDLMDMDSCRVQLSTKGRSDLHFFCHDICALIPVQNKDAVEMLLRGRQVERMSTQSFEDCFSKFGMIGHTEIQKKELDGLILKVSKRKWVSTCPRYTFLAATKCSF
jgi:hypothetical protein